jgi:hypothetical protein
LASSQILGSSRVRTTSTSRDFFASKSKIPPQLRRAGGEIREGVLDEVEAVGFHGAIIPAVAPVTLANLSQESKM